MAVTAERRLVNHALCGHAFGAEMFAAVAAEPGVVVADYGAAFLADCSSGVIAE